MAVNVEQLRSKYKELVPGQSQDYYMPDLSESLAVTISLKLQGKPTTAKDVLVRRMEERLERMPKNDDLRPFLQAIKEMYEDKAH